MSRSNGRPVTFTAFSDFLCPWCYIGALRLDRVRRRHEGDLVIEWKSFLLRPEPSTPDLERFRGYTRSWQRPAAMEPAAQLHPWSGDASPPSHSVPTAVAGKVAATFGQEAYDRYHLALFRAYFVEHRTVSEEAVQLDVAASVGLDRDEFARRLREDVRVHLEAVFDDYSDAFAAGILAVPTVVVGGGEVVGGAVDETTYEEAYERACAAAS